MKSILGLDLSLTATGIYCDVCGGSVFKPKTRGMERLANICDEIWQHLVHTDVFIIEGYSFGSKGRATFSIGELGGAVKLMLYRENALYIDVPPKTMKKFTTGNGNANKDEVLAAAIRKFDYAGHDNNEADAFMLNRMGHAYYGDWMVLTQYQEESMEKVEWSEVE